MGLLLTIHIFDPERKELCDAFDLPNIKFLEVMVCQICLCSPYSLPLGECTVIQPSIV